jgi:NAD(P)-dependent dehydrogenase (short-subunit alcohol dehydrogenase family)
VTNGLPATIVTGAATGMGRALCERLAARSQPVVAVDVSDAVLSWPAADATVVPLVADVSTEDGNAAMVETALTRFGSLGGAALNAGVCLFGSLDSMPLEQFDRMWAVNLRGVVLGIRAAAPALRANGGGAIVATASIGGLVGDPDLWAYSATKAAIISVVKSLALQLGHESIRVNAVCPGPTRDTGMSAGLDVAEPRRFETLARETALKRWGTADEMAAAMEFLLSPDASYVTGTTLVVDGGTIAGRAPRNPGGARRPDGTGAG